MLDTAHEKLCCKPISIVFVSVVYTHIHTSHTHMHVCVGETQDKNSGVPTTSISSAMLSSSFFMTAFACDHAMRLILVRMAHTNPVAPQAASGNGRSRFPVQGLALHQQATCARTHPRRRATACLGRPACRCRVRPRDCLAACHARHRGHTHLRCVRKRDPWRHEPPGMRGSRRVAAGC